MSDVDEREIIIAPDQAQENNNNFQPPRSPSPELFAFRVRHGRNVRPFISRRFRANMRTLAASIRRNDFEDNYPPALSSLPQIEEEMPEVFDEQEEEERVRQSVLTQLIISPECQMFASFTSRAQSFLSYPMQFSGELTIELLAQCCIYATGNGVELCCASCNTKFSGISEDDNRRVLAIRHIDENVECKYLQHFIYEANETPGTALVRLMREERDFREGEERRQQQQQQQQQEGDDEGHNDRRTQCPICKFSSIESLNVPCGHGFCNDCLMRVTDNRCSFCRSEVQASYRIHFY